MRGGGQNLKIGMRKILNFPKNFKFLDSPTPIIKPTPLPPFLVKISYPPITAILKKSHRPFMKGGGIRTM